MRPARAGQWLDLGAENAYDAGMNAPAACRVVVWSASLVLVAATSAARSDDWPRFRGPHGAGVAADSKAPLKWSESEGIAWKAALPGSGTSSPILVGDAIYLTCYSGFNEPRRDPGDQGDLARYVVSLNRHTGKLNWSTEVPSKLPEQEVIREGHGYASSTPACDGRRVYAFFGKSGVFALDLQGKILWHADVGDELNGWGSANSVVLHEDLVIINASVESGSLVALDAASGAEVWRIEEARESWNAPIVIPAPGGKAELVFAAFGKILSLDPRSGREFWSCETDIPWYMVPGLVHDRGVVYCIGGRSGGALAVRTGGTGNVTKTHRLWTGKRGSNVSSPIILGQYLFWANDAQSIAYCAEAKTGKILYEERLPRGDAIYASPVMADGKIYYLARDGRVFVVAARPAFELLAVNPPLERGTFNATPAIADDRLYMRVDRSLYCLGP